MRFAKQVQKLFPELERQGFRIKTTKPGWIIYQPDKSKATFGTHRTPSDQKAWNNFQADLKRVGIIEPK